MGLEDGGESLELSSRGMGEGAIQEQVKEFPSNIEDTADTRKHKI